MENFDEYDLFEEYANILHDLSMEVDELTSVEEFEEIISEMENVLMEAESDEDLSEEDYEELLALADGLISELYNDLLNLKKSNMNESKKVIRLTESDLTKLIKKVIEEQEKFKLDPKDLEVPNSDKLKKLFLSQGGEGLTPELKKTSEEVKNAMKSCVAEKNLYKVKGLLGNIETKKINWVNTIMAMLFDKTLGGKSLGQEFNEFTECVNKKVGKTISIADLAEQDDEGGVTSTNQTSKTSTSGISKPTSSNPKPTTRVGITKKMTSSRKF